MADKKKIRLTQMQINICKALAVDFIEKDRASAEAKGLLFDYEAVKARREEEMIVSYARELQRMQDWEDSRDKAFHDVIGGLINYSKTYNYIRDHVPNLKALREMDPTEASMKVGYGKKTVEDLKALQDRLNYQRSFMPKLNKAIKAARMFADYTSRHRDIISTHATLRRNLRTAERALEFTWRNYGG
jgi:hypothetical protein